MAAFKNGAFKLAIRTKKPIVPIVLTGTNTVVRKGNALLTAGAKVRIKVLKPISTEGFGEQDADKLRDLVRSRMAEVFEELTNRK